MRILVGLLPLALTVPAYAGSITAPAAIGAPDSSAANPDAAAAFYNPAAMGGADGFHAMLDLAATKADIEIDATRRGGIDPNTGEPYLTSFGGAVVPVFILAAHGEVIKDRLSLGFAATDNFVGGGHYQEDDPPPYTASTRYGGIDVTILSLTMLGSASVTLTEGLHVGGGAGYALDSISVLQASDPLGAEGSVPAGPYNGDIILKGDTSGGHFVWTGGAFFDKWKEFQLGASFTSGGKFSTSGPGSLTAPGFLSPSGETTTVNALTKFEQPLPAILRVWVSSQVNEKLNIAAGIDHHFWGSCCATEDGDMHITVTNEAGDPIGPDDGITLQVDPDIYSPRRLRSAMNVAAVGGYQFNKHFWAGLRLGYNPSAVPDFAVKSTNLDFENFGGIVSARYTAGPVTFGLSYHKFFLVTRTITNSGWNVSDPEDPNYVDARFHSRTASGNGVYRGNVNGLSLRVQVDLPRIKKDDAAR